MKKRFLLAAAGALMGMSAIAQTSVSLAECPVEMNSWWPGLLIPRATVTAAEPGSKIVMDYVLTPGTTDHRFSLCTNYGKTPLPGFEGTEADATEPTRMNMTLTADGTYSYTITEETIAKLKTSDFHGWDGNVRILGVGYTITALNLVTEAAEEPQDEALAECPIVMQAQWWPGILIPRATVTDATPGWQIRMGYEVAEGVTDARFCLSTNYGKTELPGFGGTLEDSGTPTRMNMPLEGKGTYSYTITDETIAQLKNSDFHGWDGNVRVVGTGFTMTELVLVKGSTGVADLVVEENEDAPVEYYDLRGVKVAVPAAGLYIRRQGNKVTKVFVK